MKPTMTFELAHAAASDAGNRSMRKAGRSRWNEDDWNSMVETFDRLWPMPTETGNQREQP